ncbi:hypothetical protein Q2K19_22920 [Micromonospora soli]|uniref:hypothetical protein n=1 Tax=Micromonospora sp. NBRC 110009 TaxID=3061627 RepID=UPI0026729333|nr:hypothetical protein [Micromonospora sp. NBRC 110009]WKT97016.1 hypothetical protein Q2K19_22920 [Micromonospora sp. NBRC 110009]
MTRTRTIALAIGLAVAASGALAGCGQPDVTKARLERAIGPAFANLYVQRDELLGEDSVTVGSIDPSTSCDRGGPKVPDVGPGPDWVCMIHFTDDHGQPQDGKFEVQVKADATYVAGGPSKLVGQATLTDTHGRDVPNPVFEFDGAFDPDR